MFIEVRAVMKRAFRILPRLGFLVSASALIAVLGCGPAVGPPPAVDDAQTPVQPKRGGVLVLLMNQAGDPPTFDLHQESTSATTETAGPVYDNLVSFDPLKPNEIMPDLAERWELSVDGKTYTFYLRKGVVFHNGNPFTAADVKFTLERVMDPPQGMVSPRRGAFDAVTGVDTPDAHTVRLHLERPNPSLLINLAQGWMAIYDKEWAESSGGEIAKKEMMGTGPYKLKEYIPGISLEVERNKDYWVPGRPFLDGVRHFVMPEVGHRVAALRTGRVMISRLWARDAGTLQEELGEKMTFRSQVSPSFGALYMNPQREPFDNPRVREALNLLLDRYAGVQILAQGHGTVGGYLMPGGAWSLPAEEIARLPGYAQDKTAEVESARQLLAGAGLSEGFEAEIITRNARSYRNLAVFVADQLKKLNITAKITPLETAQATERARNGDFMLLAWSHQFALDDPDAVYGEHYVCKGPRNWSKLCVSGVDTLFEKQSREVDPAMRRALVWEMERQAVPSATKIITHWNQRHDAFWSYVKDYVPHASSYNNIRYRDVWLDRP